jgi:two-component system NtrC family sensor kinase
VIIVEFEDNGPGIPSESLGRIFDPFFTTKEVGQGTGLGLSICYGIVKEHKGRIYASNAPRGGAVFTVEIPVRRPAASIRTEAEVRSAAPAVSSRGEILVVDDEEVLLDILSQALQMDGHRVESALNGASALRMIRQKRYDLIISDLKMPGMDGQELYEKVLEMDRSLARRIIFSTGDVVSPETRDFLDATGNAYLQKPFDIEQIRRVVITSLRVPPN